MTIPLFDRDDRDDRDSWCTPPCIVDRLVRLWPHGIGLDPCSNERAIVPARVRLDIQDDGLDFDWSAHAPVYVNPPYSESGPWLRKLVASRCEGVACILCDPSVSWWRDVWEADAICFPSRRIQFLAPPGVAASSFNRPVALPYFGKRVAAFASAFATLGKVVAL